MTPSGKFEAGDFDHLVDSGDCRGYLFADRANTLLDEWLEKQPVVYGFNRSDLPWSPTRCPSDTHQARLVRMGVVK